MKITNIIVCNICQAVLKLYHLHFTKIKCTDCDNIITAEQVKRESEVVNANGQTN